MYYSQWNASSSTKDLQAHLNDKPSDNAPDNTSSNVNSVDDNNLNDIPLPMDCEHEYTICNSLFQTIEEDKIHIWALN